MCHDTISFGLIKTESQPDWNYGPLQIADGVLIGNKCLYYRTGREWLQMNDEIDCYNIFL